jgi:hypothetical protein
MTPTPTPTLNPTPNPLNPTWNPPPGPDHRIADDRDRGFLDCRGEWHSLADFDVPDDAA